MQNVLTLLYIKIFRKDFLWDGVSFGGSGSGHRFSLQIADTGVSSRFSIAAWDVPSGENKERRLNSKAIIVLFMT